MLFATFYIIANIFQSYELWLLYRCFFGKSKRGAGIEFLAFVLFFAVTMLLNVFIDIPILTGLSSYVMLVLIAFFGYESGWKQGLLYSVFAFVSMTLAECIVGLATGFLDLNVFQSREYYNVWGMVALPVVQYLVVLMIRNFRNLQKGREIPILYWAVTIVLPVFSLYLDLMICQQNFYWLNMLGCTVILFVMNVLVFYLCDVQIENMRVRFEKEKLEQLNVYQNRQLKLMHQMDVKVPKDLNVSAYVLTGILTNLLDNAMEACEKVQDKKIKITIKYAKKMLIIRISNTYDGKEKFNSVMGIKTSKKDKELHGYGIKSIRHMVESVDGDFEIHTKEKWFVADVVIPLV